MTILCDIDNTLNNFSEVLLEQLNRQYSTNYQYQDITHYNWFVETYSEKCWGPTKTHAFWDQIQYNVNCLDFLAEMQRNGHKVYFVTASHFNGFLDTKINILINKTKQNYPTLARYENIIVAQNKHLIRGDVLIDDCIENLDTYPGLTICYAQPWNTEADDPYFCRTDDWAEIKKYIESSVG